MNIAALARRLLPQPCLLCGARSRDGLCDSCDESLPRLPSACPVCALPSPAGEICGACLKRPPAFVAATAAFVYAFPVDALVQRLKYGADLSIARLLGDALADRTAERPRPDLLVPMPLSPARLRERGFNQALEIARVVARRLALPLAPHACRRVRDTPPQAGLPWKERARNVRGAFVGEPSLVAGKRIAVVDDVATTGATLDELSGALGRCGAARVEAWMVARTLRSADRPVTGPASAARRSP